MMNIERVFTIISSLSPPPPTPSISSHQPPLLQPPPRHCSSLFTRDLRVDAGRSKAKRKGYSGGRIQGPGSSSSSKPKPASPSKNPPPKNDPKPSPPPLDPRVRQPDDFYKYGPYGPYAWKAPVVGKHRKGELTDDVVAMFSTVKDDKEHEEIEKYNSCVAYDTRVRRFDKNVGIKYFYAFVRQPWRIGFEVPWREWTLVAQVAVEFGGELDKWQLGFQLNRQSRDFVTKCVAWFRPDLIYIKKPRYQVRFEPQEDFITGLIELLDPETDWRSQANEECTFGVELDHKTYYGKLCGILGVPLDAHEGDVVSAYDKLDEDGKLACLEHILCSHPVELLHPFSRSWYGNREGRDRSGVPEVEKDDSYEEVVEEDGSDEKFEAEERVASDEEEDELGAEDEDDIKQMEKELEYEMRSGQDSDDKSSVDGVLEKDWNQEWQQVMRGENMSQNWNAHVSDGEEEEEEEEPFSAQLDESDTDNSKTEGNAGSQLNESESFLKAAVRPFTYVNMIKEIWLIRQMLVNGYRSTQKLLL